MTAEQIKEFCRYQHKDLCYKILISKMPVGYVNEQVYKLPKDMEIRRAQLENEEAMFIFVEGIGMKEIETTFSNPAIMQRAENRFTFDEQREASKEALGEALTMEEIVEKYLK